MQTVNDYEKDVFNGDIGRVVPSTRSSRNWPSPTTAGKSSTT